MRRLYDFLDRAGFILTQRIERTTEACEWFFHRLLSFLSIVLTPWRWFRKSDNKARGASLSDFLESGVNRILASLLHILMPWRWGRKHGSIDVEGIDPQDAHREGLTDSFEWRINSAFRSVFHFLVPRQLIGRLKASQERALLPRWFRTAIIWVLCGVADFFEFLGEWWRSRTLRKLLWALPAILMCIPLLGALILSPLYSRIQKINHYRLALASAVEQRSEASERLCLQKLEQLGFQRMERMEYDAAFHEEDLERAYERMKAIAPLEDPGYLWAHIWIANAALRGQIKEKDPWSLIQTHLQHATSIDPANLQVQRIAVEVALYEGRHDDALELMEPISKYFPEFHSELAHWYRIKSDHVKARKHAQKAADYFQQYLESSETGEASERLIVKPPVYLRMAEAYAIIGDPAGELRALEAGHDVYPQDAELRKNLVNTSSRQLLSSSPQDAGTAELFERTLKRDKHHRIATALLVRGLVRGNQDIERMVAELDAKQLLPATLFREVADTLYRQKNHTKALDFYRMANKLDPRDGFAWNNIAYITGVLQPNKVDQALEAADRAIELQPDPRFYQTRAQILMSLERWEEAAADLETALNGSLPGAQAAAAHRSLAKAYEILGDPERAAAHRSVIE